MRGPEAVCAVVLVVLATVVASEVVANGPLTTDPTKMNREWVGICPTSWTATLGTLRDFRIAQGHSACVWTLDDIDLTYGGHTPAQVRQALQDAVANWTTKPKWVLIATDYDLRAPQPLSVADWAQYNPELGHWDDYIRGLWPYMDVDDDGALEVAVGRVPASSATTLGAYVAKVIRHDTDVAANVGYSDALFLEYERAEGGRDPAWARALGDSLYDHWMPTEATTMYRYTELCGMNCPRDSALAGWNRGPGVCVAFGISSNWLMLVGFWHSCNLYFPWSGAMLAATNRFPALLGLSCGLAATDHPLLTACEDTDHSRPVAEELLLARADAGASVVIGPMRNTYQYYDFLIGKHLLTRYYAGDYSWGEVFINAMHAVMTEDASAFDHVYQYVLLGDPAAMADGAEMVGVPVTAARIGALRLPAPNPAAEMSHLSYNLAQPALVRLAICDVAGRRLRTLVERYEPAGGYTATWDLRDELGALVRPGVYFARMHCGGMAEVRRVVVVR